MLSTHRPDGYSSLFCSKKPAVGTVFIASASRFHQRGMHWPKVGGTGRRTRWMRVTFWHAGQRENVGRDRIYRVRLPVPPTWDALAQGGWNREADAINTVPTDGVVRS